jgi:hypothetical protein
MTTSEKILSIRAKAGNPNTICPTCGHKPEAPFRSYVGNKINAGCVDAIHTGRLTPISECNRWHLRPQAKEIRKIELRALSRK